MAYLQCTILKCTGMSTAAAGGLTTVYSVPTRTGNGYGAYVKTTGIDPTRLAFIINRNSSKASSVGYVDVVAGSTSGALDFQAGDYSTLQNFRIQISKTTNQKTGASDGRTNFQMFRVPDVRRFLDSNQYIKFRFSATLTASANASLGSYITAWYLPA